MDEIDRNIPTRVSYKHQDSPYDASGHVKSAMIGSSATLIIHEGKLVLGSSQGLVFVEFDGPRPREFYVQVIEKPLASEKVNVGTVYMGMHDITGEVRDVVRRSGVKDGICHVSVLHSTAGLVLAPADEASRKDVMEDIERMEMCIRDRYLGSSPQRSAAAAKGANRPEKRKVTDRPGNQRKKPVRPGRRSPPPRCTR